MPGVPGAGGPPPKRSDQRRRANKPVKPINEAPALEVAVPEPDPDWHPIALRWFESLGRSGQHVYYQDSDWLTAYAIAESMSREFKPQPLVVGGKVEMHVLPVKASALASWLKGATSLLATEGDRRRASLELKPPPEEADGDPSPPTELDEWRDRLSG